MTECYFPSSPFQQLVLKQSAALTPLTVLQYGVSLRAIDLLAADNVAGGVGKVDELAGGVEIQSSGVHQVLDGNHVLVRHLGVHVHAPDDSRAAFTVDQEELVVWFCRGDVD